MSEEDKELLARISQLAGQINRHKNQQAGIQSPNNHATHQRHNTYRHAAAPYPPRGHRVSHATAPHRHRTLNLVPSRTSSPSSASGAGSVSESGWVSRTDRHRQLINASVYEKEAQNRVKAMEETRLRKIHDKRTREKSRVNEFLKHQVGVSDAPANIGTPAGRNEITIEGIRFRVMDGGKKLVKVQDDANSASATPKRTVIAGVRFHRTKTGNLVANRVIQNQRRSGKIKKVDQRCKIFSTTGSCPKGPLCRYVHDPHKVAACKDFLKDGTCSRGESCDLSHALTPERVPNCLHYAKGHCAKADCAYTHSKSSPGAPVCNDFGFYGFCDKGADCTERHVFECPDFSNTGRCKNNGCKLLHRERASVLRNQSRVDEMDEDVSSDDDEADSDDVDSDEVAEFIEAESDDSDTENPQNFIPI